MAKELVTVGLAGATSCRRPARYAKCLFTHFPLDMEDLEAYVAGRLSANGSAKLPWRSRPRGFRSPTSPVKLSRTVFSHGASAGAKNSRVVPATFGGVSALPYKSTSGESRRNASPGSGPKC